jgi:hypothetical protein
MNRGLLLTLTEPPAAMEEEFNAWYDTEHIPERLAIPGFRSARRWVEGRSYLATYELDSAKVLESADYLARYNNQTPWSKRCLGKLVVFKRWACEQLGSDDPHPKAGAVMLAFGGEIEFRGPPPLQARRFRATRGETIILYEMAASMPGAYRRYQP